MLQRLRFAGVRVIYISQGIDSASEQAETLVAVHGLVDGLYLREMAAKIKRGLKGQLSRGLATGGVTYGYRTVPIPDPNRADEKIGCRIEVEPSEAAIIRQVFEWFTEGVPIRSIVTKLQTQGVAAPRGPNAAGAWRNAAVRRMLANPKYRGLQSPFTRCSTFLRAPNRFCGLSGKDSSSTSPDQRFRLPAHRSCNRSHEFCP